VQVWAQISSNAIEWALNCKGLRKPSTSFLSNSIMNSILKKFKWSWSSTCCNFRKHMQIEKAPANKKNHHQFDSRFFKCSQHKQIIFLFAVRFLVWLCCEYLQHISLFVCVVSICSACVVKLMKLFS